MDVFKIEFLKAYYISQIWNRTLPNEIECLTLPHLFLFPNEMKLIIPYEGLKTEMFNVGE